jgi:hypothetical protein
MWGVEDFSGNIILRKFVILQVPVYQFLFIFYPLLNLVARTPNMTDRFPWNERTDFKSSRVKVALLDGSSSSVVLSFGFSSYCAG